MSSAEARIQLFERLSMRRMISFDHLSISGKIPAEQFAWCQTWQWLLWYDKNKIISSIETSPQVNDSFLACYGIVEKSPNKGVDFGYVQEK